MRVIIAGSRDFGTDRHELELLRAIRESGFLIEEVISGGARGMDSLGERWAKERGIPVTVFPADWEGHGRAAGPIRNAEMANIADALILVWDGESRGSANMRARMGMIGKPVHERIVK